MEERVWREGWGRGAEREEGSGRVGGGGEGGKKRVDSGRGGGGRWGGGGVEVGRGMEWSGELISGLGEGGDGSEK